MTLRLLVVMFLVVAQATVAAAQSTVFLVRHAERMDSATAGPGMMANDPELSAVGRKRAESLAAMLKDAKIRAIYTTEYTRTKQTAEPLARLLAVRPTVVPAKDVGTLVQHVKKAAGNVLVVGHSNTLPDVIKALGVSESVVIQDSEFDTLFVVVGGELVRLHFEG